MKKKARHCHVTAAVISHQGKILITQRPFDDAHGGLWEFPGGKQKPGESLEQCLVREIAEELNIRIDVTKHLFRVDHQYDHVHITLHVFLCQVQDGVPECKQVQDWKWIEFSEMDRYEFTEADRKVIERLKEFNQIF